MLKVEILKNLLKNEIQDKIDIRKFDIQKFI
jgi:hypothetical protein